MSRPSPDPTTLVSGQEGWDANLRDLLDAAFSAPFPLKRYADFAALPAATSYDHCICSTADGKLWFSNGTAWKEVTLVP